ncbi:MAG: protein kinase [Gemmatimonadota bacterium]|nr:MAG: protein kinase [Gemmatimonadota bacterium]
MADLLESLKRALSDRYRIERELGSGGMATVYLARDLKHERQVAVKVLRPELAAALGSERFLREIKITANLNHPHILPLLDSGDAGGFLFYVMPYVEGESLRDRLKTEKQLPIDDALEIASEVADALGSAHRRKVIHRDIKPENILFEEGHAVVADFGIARAITAAGETQITETGIALGTPAYLSPEQAAGERELDARSDIYSLGCVLYEMLAGQPPFTGPTVESLVHQHLTAEPPPVTRMRPTLPDAISRVLAKSLAKVPADRYRSAGEMRQALSAERVSLSARELAGEAARPRSAVVPRIVVLPFENLGAAEDEYFADGITDEITSRLARLSGLGVIARSSAMRYKGKERTIAQIGEELDVKYVLDGTVRWDKSGPGASRVRVSPQLIRVADGANVWAEPYQAALAGIFEIQSAVAERVADALDVALHEPERRALAAKPTESFEAYDLYLLGRHHLRMRTPEGFERAIDCFNRAIARDASFAEAYAGLAETYASLPSFTQARASEVLPQAKTAALRALDLDSTLAEARAASGFVAYVFEWNWAAAETQLREAITLNPSYATARLYYTFLLITLGRLAEARDELERAQHYAPLSDPFDVGFGFRLLREPDRAVAKFRQSLELDPGSPVTSFQLGVTYYHDLSRIEDARAAWQVLTHTPYSYFGLDWSPVLAHLEDPAEAIAAVDGWIESAGQESIHWFIATTLYAIFGAHARALKWMERGYQERSTLLAFALADPVFDDLRSDPGFRDIVQRIGVPG